MIPGQAEARIIPLSLPARPNNGERMRRNKWMNGQLIVLTRRIHSIGPDLNIGDDYA